MVNIATNSDKTCLRIRTRSLEGREGIGGSRMTAPPPPLPVDIRIKIRHIVRVGSEKDAFSAANGPSSSKASNHFIIKLRQDVVGDRNKFKFVAESLAERDTVVLAIRNLLDKARVSSQNRIRRDQPVDDKNYHRGGSIRGGSQPVDQRQNIDPTKHDALIGSRQKQIKSSVDYEFENDHSASNGVGIPENVVTKKKGDDNLGTTTSILAHRRSSSSRIVQGRQKNRSGDEGSNIFSLDGMKDALFEETIGCNPVGCQSEALAAVGDMEFGQFAANQLSGPWCTDDVCTAGFKDFANSMKGIFDVDDPSSKKSRHSSSDKQRVMAENYITGFLGDNKAVGDFLSVKDIWSAAATKPATVSELKGRQRVQNRARNMDGKAANKSRLERQMTFISHTNRSNMSHIQTISSFDDVTRGGRWERKTNSFVLEASGQLDSSQFLLDHSANDEYLYYDSDPGDARERTLKRGPRRAMADRANKPDGASKTRRREALDIVDPTRATMGRRFKRFDDEMVSEIIEATKNESLTLLWHPDLRKDDEDEAKSRAPTCVKLWVESGVYLVDGTFLLPKLTWLPRDESNLRKRKLNASDKNLGSLDLLDICRVRECEWIDRTVHPFAHTERSFVIQTQDTVYLFEAQSKHERGRVVNGLKLVIARLASLLMLRDLRAVDEFFGGNAVPGEAPAWARTERAQDSDFPSGPPSAP